MKSPPSHSSSPSHPEPPQPLPPVYTHSLTHPHWVDLPPIILYQRRRDNLTANDKL